MTKNIELCNSLKQQFRLPDLKAYIKVCFIFLFSCKPGYVGDPFQPGDSCKREGEANFGRIDIYNYFVKLV